MWRRQRADVRWHVRGAEQGGGGEIMVLTDASTGKARPWLIRTRRGGQPRQGGRAQSRIFLVETKKARLKANRGGGCAHRASKKQSWAASLSRLGRLSFSTTPLVIAIMAMHACAHRHSARPAGPGVVALRSAATMSSVLVVVRRRV